jgi:hypothetical protein
MCGLLKLHIIEQQSGKVIKEYDEQFSIQNGRNNIIYKVPVQELRNSGDNILIASVYNENNKLLHRNFYLEQEWKNVNLPEAKLEIVFTEQSDTYVSVKSNTTTFFVDLYHPHLKFDARGFILLPGETKNIRVYGDSKGNVKADELQVYSLNKYLYS